MNTLYVALLLLLLSSGCEVYDASLLARRLSDAQADASPPTDITPDLLGADSADSSDTAEVSDLGDAPDLSITPEVAPRSDVTDGSLSIDLPEVGDVRDTGDLRDGRDSGEMLSCEHLLDAGALSAPCIEPLSGQAWDPNDPRLFAPSALALSADRVFVGDRGTGRVVMFDLTVTSSTPARIAGTGRVGGAGAGVATNVSLGSPSAMVFIPPGDLLLADSDAHGVYRIRGGMIELANPFLTFPSGPFGLAFTPDTRELFVSGGNRIYSVTLPDGAPSVNAPTVLVGLPCGTGCTSTFNSDGLNGTSTAVGNPSGLDTDTAFVYFADRQNCRVRRFRRGDPAHTVETYAGGPCGPTLDPFGSATADAGASPEIPASSLRLGELSDVKLGFDGTVYLADLGHCAIFAVRPAQSAMSVPMARIIAGSRAGCNQPTGALGGPSLGPIAALATSLDRSVLYFTEQTGQRVGRITNTALGGAPTLTFAISPGAVPLVGDPMHRTRVGRITGMAVGPGASPVLLADGATGRLWRIDPTARSVLGDGTLPWLEAMDPIAANDLPPTPIHGLSLDSSRVLLGLGSLGVIAQLNDSSLRRVAGRLASSTPGVGDAGVRDASVPLLARAQSFVSPGFPLALASSTLFAEGGRVYRVSPADPVTSGVATLLAGGGAMTPDDGTGVTATSAHIGRAVAFAQDSAGRVYIADTLRSLVWSIGLESPPRARIVAGRPDRPSTPATASDTDSLGTLMSLSAPSALAYDNAETLFIADRGAHRVRALNLTTGVVRTFSGRGAVSASPAPSGDYGPALSAQLADPCALVWHTGRLYLGECATGRVRVIRVP